MLMRTDPFRDIDRLTQQVFGTRARPEVERLVGHPVFLELVVKVRAKWRRDPKMVERLGM